MSYYASLLTDLDAANAAQRTQERKAAQEERLTPLIDRLRCLLATIPAEQLREGVSLEAIREQLKGRQRGRAHAGELGLALRRCGFTRVRLWKKSDGFSAVWRRLA